MSKHILFGIIFSSLLFLNPLKNIFSNEKAPPLNNNVIYTQIGFDAFGVISGLYSDDLLNLNLRHYQKPGYFSLNLFAFSASGIAISSLLEDDAINPPNLLKTYANGALAFVLFTIVNLFTGSNIPEDYLMPLATATSVATSHIYYFHNRKSTYTVNSNNEPSYKVYYSFLF